MSFLADVIAPTPHTHRWRWEQVGTPAIPEHHTSLEENRRKAHNEEWALAMSYLFVKIHARFPYDPLPDAEHAGSRSGVVYILVQPGDENAFLDLIQRTLPTLANPNRITTHTTQYNNRRIEIEMTGRSPLFTAPEPRRTAPAATKTSNN